MNLGSIYQEFGNMSKGKESTLHALKINPNHYESAWNLQRFASNIAEAEKIVSLAITINPNEPKARIIHAALRYHQGDVSLIEEVLRSQYKNHHYCRSIKWVHELTNTPSIFFNRWSFFDHMIDICDTGRPFYEFGVWNGASFKYLIKSLHTGFGFDTFEGLPEDWHTEKAGTYSAFGTIPKIKGGDFIKGKFEDTLPIFFSEQRPTASIINFDADLYSSTICALENCKSVIDSQTILIFDEFIINRNWEEDEYKALNEFCARHQYAYEVIAVSYYTKQVAVKLIENKTPYTEIDNTLTD